MVLLGLAFEVYEPPSQALVADVTTEDQRPAAYGLMAGAMAAAGMAAGLLAVGLAGVELRWLFVVDAATCLACALLVRLALPRGATAPAPSAGRAWRDPRLLAMLGAGTVFAVSTSRSRSPSRSRWRPAACRSPGPGSCSPSAATVVLAQPARAAGAPLDDFAAMALGYLLLGAGLLATGLVHPLPAYVAATVAWSLGDLVLLGRAYAVVAGLAPAGPRGGYLAAYGTSWGAAAVLAPLLGTRLLSSRRPAARLVGARRALPRARGRPARRTPGGQRRYSTRQQRTVQLLGRGPS